MSLVGLDLTATRARAVLGLPQGTAVPVRLEGESFDLPLAISLQDRKPLVGRVGAGLSRSRPHLACLDFLPWLGDPRVWKAGRHLIDADRALVLIFEYLRERLPRAAQLGLALPAYLHETQALRLQRIAEQARWKPVASVPAPLAAVVGAWSSLEGLAVPPPCPGVVLVGDLDGHAFTWSVVELSGEKASLRGVWPIPMLGRSQWLRRLLDGVAHRCVRLSRRDPRESADTEQRLYDHLADHLEAGTLNDLVEIHVQGEGWYHQLLFHPEELVGQCQPLVRHTLAEFEGVRLGALEAGPLLGLLLTPAAGQVPGLQAALTAHFDALESQPPSAPAEDFGDDLVNCDLLARPPLQVLGPDAIALATHHLVGRLRSERKGHGHLVEASLLRGPSRPVPDTGPARLQFRDQEHLLGGSTFTLGRDPECDLVFESELYPTVSGRHCEILFDHRAYTLCDRSRHGTLLNDRLLQQPAALHSGDWIRLGPSGPVVRFLGQSSERITSAKG